MVGQVRMKGRYAYYRCRRSYGSTWDTHCDSRYVATNLIEAAVKREIAALLSEPERLIAEVLRIKEGKQDGRELKEVNDALQEV